MVVLTQVLVIEQKVALGVSKDFVEGSPRRFSILWRMKELLYPKTIEVLCIRFPFPDSLPGR